MIACRTLADEGAVAATCRSLLLFGIQDATNFRFDPPPQLILIRNW